MSKAIILFSGGLDSTVMLAIAKSKNKECIAISFDYGQRHIVELESAAKIAKYYGVEHKIIKIDPSVFSSSSLVSKKNVPKNRTEQEMQSGIIPNTYVPARNVLFLAYALGQAELYQADEVYIGTNATDHAAYPDCRKVFINAFQEVMNFATKQAVEGSAPQLVTPLISWDKVEIIRQGRLLFAPLEMTHSCYDPNDKGGPCGACDACILRDKAFKT